MGRETPEAAHDPVESADAAGEQEASSLERAGEAEEAIEERLD
ncbi:hypothetical protein [Georgenia satyanarayanai]|nr:hypothetical protein [Georgenia satyanarayanai]